MRIMIKLLKETVRLSPKSFEAEEVREKFVNAINYTVDVLVTKKGVKYKVANPDKYKFEPLKILVAYLKIYLVIGEYPAFK